MPVAGRFDDASAQVTRHTSTAVAVVASCLGLTAFALIAAAMAALVLVSTFSFDPNLGDPEPGPARRSVLTGVDAVTGARCWRREGCAGVGQATPMMVVGRVLVLSS